MKIVDRSLSLAYRFVSRASQLATFNKGSRAKFRPVPDKLRSRSGLRQFVLSGMVLAGFVLVTSGCIQKTENDVVVYSALDREFSEPILNDIGNKLGMNILSKFDQESNKTVGLVTGIIQSRDRPQADLFWNNEILHTMRLQKMGLLEVYRSPQSQFFPDQFVSNEDQWHGFAARARVLIINTELLPLPNDWPHSIYDLADPRWRGRCAMARPLFGTTATQAAVWFADLGEGPARELMEGIAENATIVGGNKQVAMKVAAGEFAFGITDTDDAIIELEKANPVAIVFPDQGNDQLGVLLIPNTLAIIKNGPHPEQARRLVDRLLQADIEERLARGSSAQIPLSRSVTFPSRVVPPGKELKVMKVDFAAAADGWENVAKILSKLFPPGGS